MSDKWTNADAQFLSDVYFMLQESKRIQLHSPSENLYFLVKFCEEQLLELEVKYRKSS